MGYIQPFDRNQLTLPESLDSYILVRTQFV